MIVVFGGGEIACRGILPVTGGVVADCDVTRPERVTEAFERHQPSVVVYTAGVSSPGPIRGGSPERFRTEVKVNLFGAYLVATQAVEVDATMIFLASLAGLYGKPNHAGYSASKAGLISLVQSLALEGYRAYAISPGRVDTGMRERDYPSEDKRTRLQPTMIGEVVRDILQGDYQPGDNIVLRMRGFEVLPIEVHRGDGWRERLRVGEPVTC